MNNVTTNTVINYDFATKRTDIKQRDKLAIIKTLENFINKLPTNKKLEFINLLGLYTEALNNGKKDEIEKTISKSLLKFLNDVAIRDIIRKLPDIEVGNASSVCEDQDILKKTAIFESIELVCHKNRDWNWVNTIPDSLKQIYLLIDDRSYMHDDKNYAGLNYIRKNMDGWFGCYKPRDTGNTSAKEIDFMSKLRNANNKNNQTDFWPNLLGFKKETFRREIKEIKEKLQKTDTNFTSLKKSLDKVDIDYHEVDVDTDNCNKDNALINLTIDGVDINIKLKEVKELEKLHLDLINNTSLNKEKRAEIISNINDKLDEIVDTITSTKNNIEERKVQIKNMLGFYFLDKCYVKKTGIQKVLLALYRITNALMFLWNKIGTVFGFAVAHHGNYNNWNILGNIIPIILSALSSIYLSPALILSLVIPCLGLMLLNAIKQSLDNALHSSIKNSITTDKEKLVFSSKILINFITDFFELTFSPLITLLKFILYEVPKYIVYDFWVGKESNKLDNLSAEFKKCITEIINLVKQGQEINQEIINKIIEKYNTNNNIHEHGKNILKKLNNSGTNGLRLLYFFLVVDSGLKGDTFLTNKFLSGKIEELISKWGLSFDGALPTGGLLYAGIVGSIAAFISVPFIALDLLFDDKLKDWVKNRFAKNLVELLGVDFIEKQINELKESLNNENSKEYEKRQIRDSINLYNDILSRGKEEKEVKAGIYAHPISYRYA